MNNLWIGIGAGLRCQETRHPTSDVEVATLLCGLVIPFLRTSVPFRGSIMIATESRCGFLIATLQCSSISSDSTACPFCALDSFLSTSVSSLHSSRICIHQLVHHRPICKFDFLGFLDFLGFQAHHLHVRFCLPNFFTEFLNLRSSKSFRSSVCRICFYCYLRTSSIFTPMCSCNHSILVCM